MQEEFTFNPFMNQRPSEDQALISPDAQTPNCTPVREIIQTVILLMIVEKIELSQSPSKANEREAARS